jgi:hypothetical protein
MGGVYMLTLTVDPERFGSAGEAFEFVTRRRLIPELMRFLEYGLWISVLELHPGRGPHRGWPHWHILVPSRIDVRRARQWWTVRAGTVPAHQLTRVNAKWWGDPWKAANYSSKYVAKASELVPQWIRERRHIRTVSTSREVLAFSTWLRGDRRRSESEGDGTRTHRTVAEALEACGRECVLLVASESVDEATGEVSRRWHYSGRVPFSLRVLRRVADRLGVVYSHNLRHRVIDWGEPVPVIGGMSWPNRITKPCGEWSVTFDVRAWDRVSCFLSRAA